MKTDFNPPALLEALKKATPISIDTNIEQIESAPSAPSQTKRIYLLIIALGFIGGCAVLFNQIQQQKPE
jgi:hypothetical protein